MATILIIENERSITSLLGKRFIEEGYLVDIVCAGEDAITLAYTKQYNAVIIDLNLKQMHGIDVCKRIRLAIGDTIPILLLMSKVSTSTELIIKGIEAGANDYLAFPFSFEDIMNKISIMLH
jgi:DNA-binding response OmpR family regulator